MVSSTFTDLREHRAKAIAAIIRAQFRPEMMEFSSANAKRDVIDTSLKMVRDAAAYVGVISHRYGQIPESADRNPHNLSLTELEFDEATKLGRPILLFIMSDDHPVLRKDMDFDPQHREKLAAFVARAKKMRPGGRVHRVYELFDSVGDFAEKAVSAISLLARSLEGPDAAPDTGSRAGADLLVAAAEAEGLGETMRAREFTTAMRLARQGYFWRHRILSSLADLLSRYGRERLERSAENDDRDALMLLAHLYDEEEGGFAAKLACIERASVLGDPEAMAQFAAYHDGKTLEVNHQIATNLLQRAAATGHPEGLIALAVAHRFEAHGLEADHGRIIDLYRRAMTAGSLEAQFELGTFLSGFIGQEAEAGRLIARSAESGLIDAQIETAFRTIDDHTDFRSSALIMQTVGKDMTDAGKAMVRRLIDDRDLTRFQKWSIERWIARWDEEEAP